MFSAMTTNAGMADTQWPPGYSVQRTGQVEWMPMGNGVYSPPVLHYGIAVTYMALDPKEYQILGLIIGKQGIHFKKITELSGALYIFARHQWIEVWTIEPQAMHVAMQMLRYHVDQWVQQMYQVQPCFGHLPVDLRPKRFYRQTHV